MLTLIKEGIDINPHYRKITPMVADELAKWGDWKNAVWIWESVLDSRPYVVAIMSNVARGYAQIGQNEKALEYLKRAKELQPKATSVNSLEVILLSRTGKEAQAYKQTKELVAAGTYDFDLINAAYVLGARAKDWPMAINALELRSERWPEQKADGLFKLGGIYASVAEIKDEDKALAAYRSALAATPEANRAALRAQIPPAYQARL
jgi:O-antigen ligase